MAHALHTLELPTSKSLFWRQASHVGGPKEMFEIFIDVGDGRVDGDFVLPLELRPHLTEFGVGTRSRHYVVHDIDVDI